MPLQEQGMGTPQPAVWVRSLKLSLCGALLSLQACPGGWGGAASPQERAR